MSLLTDREIEQLSEGIAIDVVLDESLIVFQAKRLALELECLLNDTQDMAKVSKWWDSAMEALQLYRDACSVAYSTEEVCQN